MKHLKVRQKYSAAHHIFNSLLGVSSDDETLCLMLYIFLPNSTEAYCLWVNTSGRSRPLDKGGPGHPHPEIRGWEGRPQKQFFRPIGPHFGLKIRRGRAP